MLQLCLVVLITDGHLSDGFLFVLTDNVPMRESSAMGTHGCKTCELCIPSMYELLLRLC